MIRAKITVTREELVKAFATWYEDYKNDPTKFQDYDKVELSFDEYAEGSTAVLIKYIGIVQKGERND